MIASNDVTYSIFAVDFAIGLEVALLLQTGVYPVGFSLYVVLVG